MLKFILFILLFCLAIYMIRNHVKVKVKTFFQRGFFKTSKPYGVYCYCGKQGKGKTYSVIEFLLENADKEIYCNIKSIKGINYTYINGIEELLSLREKKNCIIVFDEIFTILQKGSKMNDDILDFLSQMRKREMIFITTAQEWLEINMTLRRYCRYQIECNMISFFGYPILIKGMYDAEQMKWSQEDNEYIAPIISTTISHGLFKVISSYDTYEQIGKYSETSKLENKRENNIILEGNNIEVVNNDIIVSDFPPHEEIRNNEKKDNFSIKKLIKKLLKSVKYRLSLFTTTIKKVCAKCQLTNKRKNFTFKNTSSLHTDFTSIDNDFWENYSSNDIE